MSVSLRRAALAVALAAPAAGAQPSDSAATSYDADGITVIHYRRPASSNVVSVQLYLLGGSRQVTPASAGIEPFLLMASEYGTRNYPGDAARRALGRTGSGIAVNAGVDATRFSLNGLKQEFDSSWAVFADRLMHPTLDSTALAIVRARMLTRAARRNASPEDLAYFLADSLAYRDHPYAVNPSGTAASIAAITAEQLRAYARDHLVTSRMLLVVVGDIEPERIQRAVSGTIGTLPRGSYVWTVPPPLTRTAPELVAVERTAQTNYVIGYISGPSRASADYVAFERAMYLLSGWISNVVREEQGLSYAAHVEVLDRGAPGAAIYMSTTRPDSALAVVHKILSAYASDVMIPRPVLRKSAESYNTAYVYATETASSHGEVLARAHLYQGDFRMAAKQAELAGRLAFSDLRGAVRTYAKNIQYVYVGDTARFSPDKVKKR